MAASEPVPIIPAPGVVKTETARIAEGRWTDANKVRFVSGTDGKARPQKIGGRVKLTATAAIASGSLRTLHAWRDLTTNQYVAGGTYKKLYVYTQSFSQTDITPYRETGTLGNNPFTTTNGSPLVTVADTSHGNGAGDTVIFAGATAVGGVTPNGAFEVVTVTSANAYVINVGSNATSGATGGGGSVTYSYEIAIGTDLGSFGFGYGVGGYGLGTYGTPRDDSTIALEPRVWSLDHFGKILIASYNGGTIYTFDPTAALPWPRAAVISNAPDDCRFVFVTAERFVVALCDDMVVNWCSQGDYTVWTPSATNTANTRTLTVGTRLIGGKVLGPRTSLILSDAACYRLQWTGNKYVHDTTLEGEDCGLISPSAIVTVQGVAYWMGSDNFFQYNGAVHPMHNVEDIRRYVFDNLTRQYGFQCAATYNPLFNEIMFTYTLDGDTAPSAYVIYNITNQSWTPGTWTVLAGTHFTQGDTRPLMSDQDGHIYRHEDGVDDDGAALPFTLTLAPYALKEGKNNLDIDGVLFDMHEQEGDITVEFEAWDRITDAAPMDSQSDTIEPTSGLIDLRVCGRYIGFTLSSDEVGCDFRMGKPVAFIRPVGTRG